MDNATFTHHYFPEEPVKKGEPQLHTMEIPVELEAKFREKFGKDLLMANKSVVKNWLNEQK
jgi:hypothetical protein